MGYDFLMGFLGVLGFFWEVGFWGRYVCSLVLNEPTYLIKDTIAT